MTARVLLVIGAVCAAALVACCAGCPGCPPVVIRPERHIHIHRR